MILDSQSAPSNPTGHIHLYEAIPSSHVPPFLQGLLLQSSISINNKVFWFKEWTYYIKCSVLFWVQSILISQSNPLKPIRHAHVYDATPSWQTPPLLQGLSIQSSISMKWKSNDNPLSFISIRDKPFGKQDATPTWKCLYQMSKTII